MSTKFEQLLDLIVNEDMDKANELFHEIVVEKSREIYENLIAEEADEDEADEKDAEKDDDESVEENFGERETTFEIGGDAADDFVGDISDSDSDAELDVDPDMDADMGGDDVDALGDEGGSTEDRIDDLEDALAQLQQEFDQLLASEEGEEGHDDLFGDDELGSADDMSGDDDMGGDSLDSMGGDMGGDEFGRKESAFEGRRMTREYVDKVGNDWEKNSQKTQGQPAGAGSGDKDGSPTEGKSPISSGKGKPTTGATAGNILGSKSAGEGSNTGTSPNGKTGGLVKNAQKMNTGNGNVPGGKMGVKNLSKVAGGHGAEKKGSGPAPVGSGTGDKAGQTSMGNQNSMLKKL